MTRTALHIGLVLVTLLLAAAWWRVPILGPWWLLLEFVALEEYVLLLTGRLTLTQRMKRVHRLLPATAAIVGAGLTFLWWHLFG